MSLIRRTAVLGVFAIGLGPGAPGAQENITAPHRTAGWWQMSSQLTGGRSMTRNLCLDATSDARHDIFRSAPGCKMSAHAVAGGYSYAKVCGSETTTGTAIGDFGKAYRITESQGAMRITTDARWMGTCPAGHGVDTMW